MNNEQLFRQALQRQNERAARLKMPDDMEQRVMQRIKPRKTIRHWLYPISLVAAAASVLLLLTLHYSEEPTSEETVADLRQEEPTSEETVADLRQEELPSVEAVADLRQGVPTSVSNVNHSIDCGQSSNRTCSIEESTTLDEQIEYVQQTNRLQQAEPLAEVLTERDIPITRPENYKYTPEEIALMKKQAREAYLKWVELELEIAKYNQEKTAQY